MKDIFRSSEYVWLRGGTTYHPGYNKMMAHASYWFEGDDFPAHIGLGNSFHGESIIIRRGKEKEYWPRPINRLGATCIAFLQAMMCIPNEKKADVSITFNVNPAGRRIVEAIHGEPIEDFYLYYMDKIRAELSKFKKVNFVFHTYERMDEGFGRKWTWVDKRGDYANESGE